MRKLLLILFSVAILSCSPSVTNEDIQQINGYWEIEKVIMPDGTEKDFPINMTYDYFEIKDNTGFRKKGAPRFDGKFEGNDVMEQISIVFEDSHAYIHYETSFMKWKEQILSVSDQKLVLSNDEKKEYHYKRAAPLNFIEHGKTSK